MLLLHILSNRWHWQCKISHLVFILVTILIKNKTILEICIKRFPLQNTAGNTGTKPDLQSSVSAVSIWCSQETQYPHQLKHIPIQLHRKQSHVCLLLYLMCQQCNMCTFITILNSTVSTSQELRKAAYCLDVFLQVFDCIKVLLHYYLFYCPLTNQDRPAWCLSWEERRRARTSAWPWSRHQASAISPPDAMTTGEAAGCLRNGVGHDAGRHPVCRMGMWRTHWGSSLEALCSPEKREKWRRKCVNLESTVNYHIEKEEWKIRA